MALELVEGYRWVVAAVVVNVILNQWMGIMVSVSFHALFCLWSTTRIVECSETVKENRSSVWRSAYKLDCHFLFESLCT